MRKLGTPLPNFQLVDTVSGATVSSAELIGAPLVVAFICNHCPFVVHLKPALAEFGRTYGARGARIVAISSNDVATYPQDGPLEMKRDAAELGYPFPYLFDETQDVARAFDAACTPDFFAFDAQGLLRYRGQFDDSRPGNGKPITGSDLGRAVDALLAGTLPESDQKPSIGCNIKWRAKAAG
jgi:thiol-disulfide isomerase/thioredoxin